MNRRTLLRKAASGRRWVELDVSADAEDADHMITPDERLKIVMARQ